MFYRQIATTGNTYSGYYENNLGAQNTPVQEGRGVICVLQKDSVRARCPCCFTDQFTRVDSKVSSGGVAWAIGCCCFGSPLLSLLVLFMDGFKEFTHYCPACNSLMGICRPTFSGGMIALLVLVSLGIICLQILALIYVVLPMLANPNSPYSN